MPYDSTKVCGTCQSLKSPLYHQGKLIQVCKKATNTSICTQTLAELTYEVLTIYHKNFWCNKNKCWTHILDNCSLWQPQDKCIVSIS
ncbi:MAG: hypothetical protein P8X97_04975 [Candidatus Bathyarchaeota archaeon]